MASQITGIMIVCSTACPGADQRNHQSSASLAFVKGIHRCIPPQRPVTRSVYDQRLNQQLNKQWRRQWFETPSRSLWRHCNERPLSVSRYAKIKILHGKIDCFPLQHSACSPGVKYLAAFLVTEVKNILNPSFQSNPESRMGRSMQNLSCSNCFGNIWWNPPNAPFTNMD